MRRIYDDLRGLVEGELYFEPLDRTRTRSTQAFMKSILSEWSSLAASTTS